MPINYFHCSDPVENLRLQVIVREVNSSASEVAADESDPKVSLKYIEKELSWQEKIFSPDEIADYVQNKDSNRGTVSQLETRSSLARKEKSGDNIMNLLDKTMLYTYIDRDHYEQDSPIIGGEQPFYPKKPMNDSLVSYKTMTICLATDLQIKGLLEDRYLGFSKYYEEYVLCTIKIHQDGVVEISPSISKLVAEPTASLPGDLALQYKDTLNPSSFSNVQSFSIFMGDHSTETALRKGLLISSFRLRTSTGSEFEYIIYNKKELLSPLQIEANAKDVSVEDHLKATENRGRHLTVPWKPIQSQVELPRTNLVMLEFLKGSNFRSSKLFVKYHIWLPSNWKIQSTTPYRGDLVSETDSDNGDKGRHCIEGVTHTATVIDDNFAASLLSMRSNNLRLSLFKGLRIGQSLDFPSRVVLGCSFLLTAVASVFLGANVPVWILPILVLVIGAFIGLPISSIRINIRSKGYKFRREKEVLIGSSGADISSPVAVFNHLVQFQASLPALAVKGTDEGTKHQRALAVDSSGNLQSNQPIVFFEVYGVGIFKRSVLESYGYFHLPDSAGSFELEVSSWLPAGGISSQMTELFLGNQPTLKSHDWISLISNIHAKSSKFASLTRPSGALTIRGQVVSFDAAKVKKAPEDPHHDAVKTLRSSTASRPLSKRIDAAVRASVGANRVVLGRPVSNSAAPESKLGGSIQKRAAASDEKPSVRSILDSINANSKASATTTKSRLEAIKAARLAGNAHASAEANLDEFGSSTLGLTSQRNVIQKASKLPSRYPVGAAAPDEDNKIDESSPLLS